MSHSSSQTRPGLSTSQLENSLRRSQSLANSVNNSNAHRQAESMQQTNRLLKVLQSHPIQRPQAHVPYPHVASPSPFASSLSASGRSSPPPAARDGFDVLEGFRRELERVRKDVAAWSQQEAQLEQFQRARMNHLAQTEPTRHFDQSMRSTASQAPTASLMSTISTLLHSPPKPRSVSTLPTDRSNAFGLAPSNVQTPFASVPGSPLLGSSRSARSLGSSFNSHSVAADPHVQSLAAKGNMLLESQSTQLDSSQARLGNVLSQLHSWKESRQTGLQHELATLESKHAREVQELIESFEAQRSKVEESFRRDADTARKRHAREVEEHVHELNLAVEKEFSRYGGLREEFEAPFSTGSMRATAGSTRGNTSGSTVSSHRAALDRSMRLEHLQNSGLDTLGGNGHLNSHGTNSRARSLSPDSDRESERAKDRRKRLAYSSALHASSSAGHNSKSASTNSSKIPPRQTIQELLASSDEEEQTAEEQAKQALIKQAEFIRTQRLKSRGIQQSPASRSHKSKLQVKAHERDRVEKQEARMLLHESSSDEADEDASQSQRDDPYARMRASNSVRFAPKLEEPRSSPTRKRPRTEKEEASTVFQDTSSEEEPDPKPSIAAVDKSSVDSSTLAGHIPATVASGRIHTTPAKAAQQHHQAHVTSTNPVVQADTLKEKAKAFQKRVAKMQPTASTSQVSRVRPPQSAADEDVE